MTCPKNEMRNALEVIASSSLSSRSKYPDTHRTNLSERKIKTPPPPLCSVQTPTRSKIKRRPLLHLPTPLLWCTALSTEWRSELLHRTRSASRLLTMRVFQSDYSFLCEHSNLKTKNSSGSHNPV